MIGTSRRSTELESRTLDMGLDGIQIKSGLLNVLACSRSELQVGVQGGIPASKETALDLGVLAKASLANSFHCERILLEGSGQGILASSGVMLVEDLAAGQTGAGDGMVEGLGLGLRGRGSNEGGLGFAGRSGGRKEGDLFAHGAAKVLEGLSNIGGVVVSLVGIL